MSPEPGSVRSAIVDALLRIPSCDDGSLVAATDTEIPAGRSTLQLGRSSAGELVALIEAEPETVAIPSRAGLSLTVQQLRARPDASPTMFLVLTCHRDHLEATFLDLVGTMAQQFIERPNSAAESMVRQYLRWRELFADLPRPRLSRAQVAGVLAELLALRDLVGSVDDPIDAWQGPMGARHDFLSGRAGLEIKAVTGTTIEHVTIHGVEQLVAPSNGSLHLAVYRLEPSAGKLSIDSVFRDLGDSGLDPLELREKLQMVGVEPGSEPAAMEWQLAEQRLFVVDDGFPRITPDSFIGGGVPPGVTGLNYSISLVGLEPLATDQVGTVWCGYLGVDQP